MAHQLEPPPRRARLRHLEQDQLRSAERVNVLKRDGRDDGRDEAAPHHVAVVGERVELLQPEEHAAERAPERDGDARCGCGGEKLALPCCSGSLSGALAAVALGGSVAPRTFVLVVLAQHAGKEERPAARDVDEGAFFSEGEAGGDGEGEAEGLDEENPWT